MIFNLSKHHVQQFSADQRGEQKKRFFLDLEALQGLCQNENSFTPCSYPAFVSSSPAPAYNDTKAFSPHSFILTSFFIFSLTHSKKTASTLRFLGDMSNPITAESDVAIIYASIRIVPQSPKHPADMTRKRGQNDLQATRNRRDDYHKAQITGEEMDYHQDRQTDHAGGKYDDDDRKEESNPYAEFDDLAEKLLNRDIVSELRQQGAFAYDALMLRANSASSVVGVNSHSQAATSTANSVAILRGRSTSRTSTPTLTDQGKHGGHRCKVGSCWTDGCKFKI